MHVVHGSTHLESHISRVTEKATNRVAVDLQSVWPRIDTSAAPKLKSVTIARTRARVRCSRRPFLIVDAFLSNFINIVYLHAPPCMHERLKKVSRLKKCRCSLIFRNLKGTSRDAGNCKIGKIRENGQFFRLIPRVRYVRLVQNYLDML